MAVQDLRNETGPLPAMLERLKHGNGDPELLVEACDLCLRMHQPRMAANLASRLIRKAPQAGIAHFLLGSALGDLADWRGAATALRKAAALDPGNGAPLTRLAEVLVRLGQRPEALGAAREALAVKAAAPEILLRLAGTLKDLGEVEAARTACERALAIDGSAEAHSYLAWILKDLKDFDGALEHSRRALELDPEDPSCLVGLGADLLGMGDAEGGLALMEQAMAKDPTSRRCACSCIFHGNLDPRATLESFHRKGKKYMEGAYAETRPRFLPDHDRNPDRKLRIGLVSPDYRDHTMRHWLPPLMEGLDREQFRLLCFVGNAREDEWTRYYRSRADEWIPTTGQTTDMVAARVVKAKVDILVDLAGATENSRLDVFAVKPAPVLVSMLGFDRSIGLRTMDWRLTTERADPPGEADRWSVERIWRLKGAFSYRPPAEAPEVGELPARRDGRIHFGFLGATHRVGTPFMQAAARLLAAIPDSRLHLLIRDGAEEAHKAFKLGPIIQAGLDPGRVVFHRRTGLRAFMDYYNQIDIMLNSFPADAGTTVCESLWMGVPALVLDRPEALRHTGRAVNAYVGLEDWVAQDLEGWIAIAKRWSADLDGLAALRAGLRARCAASPMRDEAASARAVAAALRGMWQDWCLRA